MGFISESFQNVPQYNISRDNLCMELRNDFFYSKPRKNLLSKSKSRNFLRGL